MIGEVRFHEDAGAEYEAAFEWYFLRSGFVASRFAEEVNRAIAMISEAPKRWPTANYGIRKFLLERFPFAIFHREILSGIQVLAVCAWTSKAWLREESRTRDASFSDHSEFPLFDSRARAYNRLFPFTLWRIPWL